MIAKNFSHQQALKIILVAANDYKENLENKNFMIVYYESNKLKYKLLNFSGENFCHLTGAKANVSSTKFYKLCTDKMLSIKDFAPPNSTMNLKLAVLPYLSGLFFNHCLIGNFLKSGILLQSDYFLGNSKNVLSVGFLSRKTYDIPRTLLNQGIKELTNPTLKVEAILRKNKADDYYSEYTYCNKSFDISLLDKCNFSHMIKDLHYYKDNNNAVNFNSGNEENLTVNKSDLVKKSNLSPEQITALSKSSIPFQSVKTADDNFTIMFNKLDLDKVNQALNILPKQHDNKPKR